MAFARIPLNFATMSRAYKDYLHLPSDIDAWLKAVNASNLEKWKEKHPDGKGAPPKRATSCCMQASLSFNATIQPIPKAGSRDRQNETLDGGKNYILTVDEFRAYLTFRYGPTDQVPDLQLIKGKKGVLILANSHMEFWDGENWFQSLEGAKLRGGDQTAVIGWADINQQPRWFWEINDGPGVPSAMLDAIPDWVQGWWTVYDGNYYYYYFHTNGMVNYIGTRPSPKWIPPLTVGNQGKVEQTDHGFKIVWNAKGPPPPTEETFIRLNWTSTTEMNGLSNKYAPLFARKMTL